MTCRSKFTYFQQQHQKNFILKLDSYCNVILPSNMRHLTIQMQQIANFRVKSFTLEHNFMFFSRFLSFDPATEHSRHNSQSLKPQPWLKRQLGHLDWCTQSRCVLSFTMKLSPYSFNSWIECEKWHCAKHCIRGCARARWVSSHAAKIFKFQNLLNLYDKIFPKIKQRHTFIERVLRFQNVSFSFKCHV